MKKLKIMHKGRPATREEIEAAILGEPLPPAESTANDPVNNPAHYTEHPSGVECIQIAEHMNFCLGNALKYIWRADLKGNAIEDLEKARWYLNREIQRRVEAKKESEVDPKLMKAWKEAWLKKPSPEHPPESGSK